MKDLSEVFSSLEGTMVEVKFTGHGPEGTSLVETGRVISCGTDYVALERVTHADPEFIPFTAVRSFRALR